MIKKNILWLAISLCSMPVFAQDAPKKWAIVANFGHEDDLSPIPVSNSLVATHNVVIRPRIELGMERTWVERRRFRLFQDAKLTYHNNTYSENAIGLGTDIGFEFKIFKGLRLTPRLGAHYNRAKASDVQYRYENNKWVSTSNTNPAVARGYFKGGIDVSYRFMDKFDVVAGTHLAILTPYIPGEFGIPLYPNKAFNIGVRYFL
ncbi:MAG: hypothetical protein RL757_559 [Bacteroidota bacterium]|jgi:hypothetical protein